MNEIGVSKRAEIVARALSMVNKENDSSEVFRKKLVTQQIPELFVTHEMGEILSPLDDEYCDMDNEDIVTVLGGYFRKIK